jgi:hypothetical protein
VDVDMASAYIHLAISSIPLRVFPIHLNFQDQKNLQQHFYLSVCEQALLSSMMSVNAIQGWRNDLWKRWTPAFDSLGGGTGGFYQAVRTEYPLET